MSCFSNTMIEISANFANYCLDMREEERYDNSFDDEALEAVRKFEDMKKNNQSCFFDVVEFESIIDFYIENNNSSKAFEAASLASSQHPNSISIQLRKAKVYLDKGRAVEALRILKRLESIEPGNDEIFVAKGTAMGILGDINNAIKMFDYALSINQDDENDTLFSIVTVLHNLNFYEQSIPYIHKLIKKEPFFRSHIYDLAYSYERIEDFDNSIKYYNVYLDEDPFSDSAWYNLGIIYNKQGQYEKAIEAYDYALAINSQNTFALFNKGNIYWFLERYRDAIQIYHEYLDSEPESFEAMTCLAECYDRVGDIESSKKYYHQAIELSPEFGDAWYGLGLIELNQDHYDDSLNYLRIAINTDSENPEFWYAMGRAQYSKKEVKAALKCMIEAVKLDSYYEAAWADMGKILVEENLVEYAIPYLIKAIKVAGDIPGINYLLASFYNIEGNSEVALHYLKHAVEIDKDSLSEFVNFFKPELSCDEILKFISENNL